MNVQVEPKAREWIAGRTGVVTIDPPLAGGG